MLQEPIPEGPMVAVRLARLAPVLALGLLSCNNDKSLNVFHAPPSVSITQPADGATFTADETIQFRGMVADDAEGPEALDVSWSSSLDRLLNDEPADGTGLTAFAITGLSAGTHVITLQAVNTNAKSAEDYITITIQAVDQGPSIRVLSPSGSAFGVEGVPFSFQVRVSDGQDAAPDLFVWFESDVDGVFCEPVPDADGNAGCDQALRTGNHMLTFGVEDTAGNAATAEVDFYVEPADDNDNDGDGYTEARGDCDDDDPNVRPGATEVGNGIDDDCDGEVDEGTVYYDDDGDCACEQEPCRGSIEPSCVDLPSGDCNDRDPSVGPEADEVCNGTDDDCDGETDEGEAIDAATWYRDLDGDLYGDASATAYACSAPSGYVGNGRDCDDRDAAVSPGATEVCNGTDDNCDGTVDEATASDAATWYRDADSDGYGSLLSTTRACTRPTGYVADSSDCNDANSAINPAATELCDSADNDCDGSTDEADAADAPTWYIDADSDGYGSSSATRTQCTAPAGYVANTLDCDDSRASVSPAGVEVCDELDNDCDGSTDEGVTSTFYRDADGDGYGNASSTTAACSAPSGYVANASDCDDGSAAVSPAATERCNSIDDNCDGTVDEATASDASTWYRDADGDGYGSSSTSTRACSLPSGYVASSTDCNDASSAINPAATEVCDSQDNDCDGTVDEADAADARTWYVDADGDGYGSSSSSRVQCSAPSGYVANASDCNDGNAAISPAATEVCDSTDNDCDGSTDEGVTSTFYRDADGDGYGNPSSTTTGCSAPSGYVSNAEDCNDSDATRSPLTVWYRDSDGDGYGDSSATRSQCTQPTGYVSNSTDCNDLSSSAYPGATERCDSIDNDCDGFTDEINASGCTTWYYDYDGDGYGSSSASGRCYCSATGYYRATNTSDCYDSNINANPGATAYYSSNRGDGSYDYNCDGVQSKRYTDNYECLGAAWLCISSSDGWTSSSDPACGSTGTWGSGCSASVTSCSAASTTSRTQTCR